LREPTPPLTSRIGGTVATPLMLGRRTRLGAYGDERERRVHCSGD